MSGGLMSRGLPGPAPPKTAVSFVPAGTRGHDAAEEEEESHAGVHLAMGHATPASMVGRRRATIKNIPRQDAILDVAAFVQYREREASELRQQGSSMHQQQDAVRQTLAPSRGGFHPPVDDIRT